MKKNSLANKKNLNKNKIKDKVNYFTKFSKLTSDVVGNPSSFILAFVVIIVWSITGPIFHYSDTWQLVMNTTSSIVTFLIVFLIQNTQNRDTEILKIKLDELIRSNHIAKNFTLNLEYFSDDQLKKLEKVYKKLSKNNNEVPKLDLKK